MTVFPPESRAAFAANYPEVPHKLRHALQREPLLELDALARLAEALAPSAVEYNFADLPIGITAKPDPTGIPIGETIRRIGETGSWAALKNIEQVPEYEALLHGLLDELRPLIEARTGALQKPQGFIFITSPGGMTPYHFDPEHNILLQIRGSKVMTQFPAGDPAYAPDEIHETYHTGGGRELTWRDELLAGGTQFPLQPGEALFVPVMAPPFRAQRAGAFGLAFDHMAVGLVVCRSGRPGVQRRAAANRAESGPARPLAPAKPRQGTGLAGLCKVARPALTMTRSTA